MTDVEIRQFHDKQFKRLIFASVLGIQFHPRNADVFLHDSDVIYRSIEVTKKAFAVFEHAFPEDDIPF